ncbi:peptidase domain protein [Oceaniovalibus guishaninsula JLT2003]|uniref:Peptidase domain protein n=1 Tax=Oceaniovalibus guishaninsula JLT2003 TaxID=1231392 RepID=K2I6B3_9RHOB|nr:M10 family metallopeptidase [Oceaniovalibus guishaninsula]EKE44525.1 peptidase domain protein [Oceaniovalibus guishaninsula JLT2003]
MSDRTGRSGGGFDPLDTIHWGEPVSDPHVTVYFTGAGETVRLYGESGRSEGFNAYEQAQFRAAFDLISAVSGLTFEVVQSRRAADFVLALDTDEIDGEFLGIFMPPGEPDEGIGVFNGAMWDRHPGGDLAQGGAGFVTIVHELLHGLGLAHPHDRGGSSTLLPGIYDEFTDTGRFGLNQGVFTMMSYIDGFVEGPVGTPASVDDWGSQFTPMALDIALLQKMYGANYDHAAGATTYLLPDANRMGTGWQSIWDGGGDDTIRHDGNRDAVIDLRPATLMAEQGGGGFISAVDGIAGGFTIAAGVRIERALGGGGDDRLIAGDEGHILNGRNGDDDLRGGRGDDRLIGGRGDDTVFGGRGADIARLGGGDDTYRDTGQPGNAGGDTVFGGRGRDTIAGGGGHDRLLGGMHADTLSGGRGRDDIHGGLGRDRIAGGGGADTLSGGTHGDTIRGGRGNDLLDGGRGNDVLRGGDGADILKGGAGRDVLTGDAGRDVFVFALGFGADRITDFALSEDALSFDATLADLAGIRDDRLPDTFASLTRDGVLFDFGNGDSLLLEDVTDLTGFALA